MKTKRGDARNTAGRWKRSFHMGEQLVLGRAILKPEDFSQFLYTWRIIPVLVSVVKVAHGDRFKVPRSGSACYSSKWIQMAYPWLINRYYHPDDFYTSSWEPILQVGLSPLEKRMTVVRLWGGENPEAVCKSRPFGHLQNSWKKHPIQQEETSTNQQGCTKHTSWRLNQPIWKKKMLVRLDHLPADSGWTNMLETTT